MSPADRDLAIERLRRNRPRDRFVRRSLIAFGALLVGAWFAGGFDLGDALSEQRLRNVDRFLGEIRPFPLQGEAWDHGVFLDWARDLWVEKGALAAGRTLGIAVLAIVLAALLALPFSLAAARTVSTPEPYVPSGRPPTRANRWAWRGIVWGARSALVFLRALPEYVWAYLALAILGPTAWPAVLALALHNTGILGRLYAETVENVPTRVPAALRGLGAGRTQVAAAALGPALLPRLLLFFFYRWETCVREATVLGMLGVVSLGSFIADARVRGRQDEFVFLVLLGAAIVLAGDLVSTWARGRVRRAS
ncbi:MAG: PhnE/PtxC family ABC transporter permease [Planctomycetota bacterium JB042]